MLIDAEEYQRILGDELRKLRRSRGWTRKELNQHLQSEISLQTLATYELGTRQCSVVRLVELCVAMDELPQDLLAKVHRRVFVDEPGRVRVDLRKVVADASADLLPLRRWAEDRLRQAGEHGGEIALDLPALERMAELCGLPTVDLIARLRRYASRLDALSLDRENSAARCCAAGWMGGFAVSDASSVSPVAGSRRIRATRVVPDGTGALTSKPPIPAGSDSPLLVHPLWW